MAVFQWGWLAGLLGVHQTGPMISLLPIFLIGIVFGLAMDYEVFLVTRMREEHVHGADARDAVVTGFSHGARVVTAAAIMVSVFAGFITSPESFIKSIGFALAISVFFDAVIVRLTIVPAMMTCSGDPPGGSPAGWTGPCRRRRRGREATRPHRRQPLPRSHCPQAITWAG